MVKNFLMLSIFKISFGVNLSQVSTISAKLFTLFEYLLLDYLI